MDQGLNQQTFKLADCIEMSRAGGQIHVKHTRRLQYLELTDADWDLLRRFDGTHTVGNVLLELLTAASGPDIERFYSLVLKARTRGFLVDADSPATPNEDPEPEGSRWPLRWDAPIALMLALVAGGAGMVAWTLYPPALPMSALSWLVALALVPILVSVANAAKGIVISGLGCQVYSPALSLQYGFPVFAIDDRDACLRGRAGAMAVAAQALAVPPLAAAVSALLGAPAAVFAAAIAMFLLTSPFGDSPGHTFLKTVCPPSPRVPRLGVPFLRRNLLRYLFTNAAESSEDTYLFLYCAYAISWFGGLLWLVGGIVQRQGEVLLQNAVFADNTAEAVPAITASLLLSCMVVFPLLIELRVVARNIVTVLTPVCLRTESRLVDRAVTPVHDPDAMAALLGETMLFANLDRQALIPIASSLHAVEVQPGTAILRAGERGEALFVIEAGAVAVTKDDEAGNSVRVAELGRGDVFGEIALLDDVPRTATVTSLERTRLLVLPRSTFEEVVVPTLGGAEIRRRIQIAAFLRRHDLFKAWPETALIELARDVTLIDVAGGETIIREGDTNSRFYIVYEGEFQIQWQDKTLDVLGPGEIFGEISLLKHIPPVASVTALTLGRCLSVTRERFNEFLCRDPDVAVAMENIANLRLLERDRA